MIRFERCCWLLVLGALTVCSACAITNDSPALERNYRVIIDRNAFGLKPPPPPPTNAPAEKTTKDEILLTGIKSLGGLRAYFMTKAAAGKTPEFYSLGPDEKMNGLEVLQINPADGSVRVRNSGVESVMTFASNGVKPPATPTTTPGAPPAPGAAPATVHAGAVTAANPSPVVNAGMPTAGTRQIPSRLPRGGMGGAYGAANGASNMEINQTPPSRPNPYAGETDVLLMELQKRANPNVVFPPTPGMGGPPMPGGPPGPP